MYLPRSFREDDPAILQEVICVHSFATLVTDRDGAPYASHLPFRLDPDRFEQGALLAHMARANPHWRSLDPDREALVIFQGPHTYISPRWYEGDLHVPTWNYVAVHVYGKPRIIGPGEEFYALLRDLVATYEAGFDEPWRLEDRPREFVDELMQSIVAFELRITRIEGKLKLSQNREEGDQKRVLEALASSPRAEDREVAGWMARVQASDDTG